MKRTANAMIGALLLMATILGWAPAQELKLEWGGLDTGIVSQNISLFCAATEVGTRPRAAINREGLKTLLKLTDTQYPLLNHPVGYKK